MIYQFVHLTTGLHQVSDEVVCACVCACVRACVRPSMRVCVCVRVVSQPNHYTLKTVMTVLRNSCILLLHALFQYFFCRRVLASCWIKHTYFPFLVTLVLCLAHYHHTMYCSPSLQLLHRLTLRALHVSG